jgi:hypothetical protein
VTVSADFWVEKTADCASIRTMHSSKEHDELKPETQVPSQSNATAKRVWSRPELTCYGDVSVATNGITPPSPGDGINNLTV